VFLQHIFLEHFRNYTNLDLACDQHTNVFIGANGQGKTNLLEAIYYLCVARSSREAQDRELLQFGSDYFMIRGQGCSSEGIDVDLQIKYAQHIGKKAHVNDSPRKNLSELFGIIAAVVISPDDRTLVQGSPGSRRRFIDIAISQANAAYLSTLKDYRKVVRQRNEALRHHREKPYRTGRSLDLDIWNTPLVRLGSRIMQKREEVVSELRIEEQ